MEYVVLTVSTLNRFEEVRKIFKGKKLVVPLGAFAEAMRRGIDVDKISGEDVWIRAYNHKPPKLGGLEKYDSEAVLLAEELSAELVTDDPKVSEVAKSVGVRVIVLSDVLSKLS
jgi:predicted nucleic acid-binding protein